MSTLIRNREWDIFHVYSIQWSLSTEPCRYELVKTRAVFCCCSVDSLKLAVLARVYRKLQTVLLVISDVQGPFTESTSADCTESVSVVGGVLSLIIILIIGGSALGFILKNRKLKSEKQ